MKPIKTNEFYGLPTVYQQFIHQSRYARWLESEGRRETWVETVRRYCEYMFARMESLGYKFTAMEKEDIFHEIASLGVMPSMRAMMTSGPALDRDHIAGFNCSYLPFDHVRAFDECLYILMCGTGVGFSVERQFIKKLPEVPEAFTIGPKIVVEDSKMGWAQSVQDAIAALYAGQEPEVDVSKVRPAGAVLKTFGGRASGPAPLVDLHRFILETFRKARGRKLNSTEVHDIACKIGESVVVGGVRRSALISLSNLSDQRMRDAKSGEWWTHNPQRRLANNSVAYTEKPEVGQFMEEWHSIFASKSGERGIFNRQAAIRQCEKFGRDSAHDFGTNPCGEIILRPNQFCNLTEIVARATDTEEDLERKVRVAAFLGTYQSTLTDYQYLRPIWKENSEAERLLGVSITGIMDTPILNGAYGREVRNSILVKLRDIAREENARVADEIGIERSAAITCVKPSGTVSQLTDSSSGIHTRFAPAYIRRARNDDKDPLTGFMESAGVPSETDNFAEGTKVFAFPITAPEGSITRHDRTAIQELETWLDFKTHWCEHNPSVTINVREHEWPEVGAWVWNHFDDIAGVSFLPHDDHVYQQAPYEDATPETISEMEKLIPDEVDWTQNKEGEDRTVASQELACVGGSCEI